VHFVYTIQEQHFEFFAVMDINIDDYADAKTIREGKATVFLPPSVFYNPVQEFNRDLTIAVISQFSHDLFDASTPVENELKEAKSELSVLDPDLASDNKNKSSQVVCDGLGIETPMFGSNADDSFPATADLPSADINSLNSEQHNKNGLRILEALAASGLRSVRFALEIPNVKEIITNDYDRTAVKYIKKNAEVEIHTCVLLSLCVFLNGNFSFFKIIYRTDSCIINVVRYIVSSLCRYIVGSIFTF